MFSSEIIFHNLAGVFSACSASDYSHSILTLYTLTLYNNFSVFFFILYTILYPVFYIIAIFSALKIPAAVRRRKFRDFPCARRSFRAGGASACRANTGLLCILIFFIYLLFSLLYLSFIINLAFSFILIIPVCFKFHVKHFIHILGGFKSGHIRHSIIISSYV